MLDGAINQISIHNKLIIILLWHFVFSIDTCGMEHITQNPWSHSFIVFAQSFYTIFGLHSIPKKLQNIVKCNLNSLPLLKITCLSHGLTLLMRCDLFYPVCDMWHVTWDWRVCGIEIWKDANRKVNKIRCMING